MPEIDTDRIAASSALFDLSGRFAIEATMWADPGCKDNLARTARHLAQLARTALNTSELAVSDAYIEASTILIAHIGGARRFLHAIHTPPRTDAEAAYIERNRP